MISLENKKVIVTGATGGIGSSVVEKFIEAKATVLATGRNTSKLEELKKKFKNLKTLTFDTSKHEDIEKFIDNSSNELGGNVDILINNAGINQDNLTIRMDIKEWKKVIDINLTSTFLLSKFAIKKMLKNKYGKIVNITSVIGHTGNVGQSNYAASKAAIISMSKSLALEYAKKNITVNCIAPGFIETPMTEKLDDKRKDAILNSIPMNRIGTPKDLSSAIIFLASQESSYITGQTLHINGGLYMN
jgi:3-oxoacyl-[acyl-carrier protein] reductase